MKEQLLKHIDRYATAYIWWSANNPEQNEKLLIATSYVAGALTMLLIYICI